MPKIKNNKDISISVRLTEELHNRAKRACFRDEIKLNEFMRRCLEDGTEKLLKRQEKYGFKLQELI